jgi:hypothetical protein
MAEGGDFHASGWTRVLRQGCIDGVLVNQRPKNKKTNYLKVAGFLLLVAGAYNQLSRLVTAKNITATTQARSTQKGAPPLQAAHSSKISSPSTREGRRNG